MAITPSGEKISVVDRFVARWMELAGRFPRTAILIIVVLLALAGAALPRIAIDADSSKMLSPDLPAQQRAAELNEAFTTLKSQIVILVQAPQADAADLAVQALVDRLKTGSKWIESVFASSVNPFMVSHGFLYRDTSQVETMFARLSKSSNLIATLRTHPTLEGFLGVLDQAAALAGRAEIGPGGLDPLFNEAAKVFEAHNAGGSRIFGWTSLLGNADKAGQVLRVITVDPVLDTTRLSPAGPALDVIDKAIAALPPEIAAPVEIGITGEPALRAEEMQSVFGTVVISTTLSLVLVALLLWIGLGSPMRSVVAFASLLASLALTTGFAAAVVQTLNLVSVAFVVLMVGLGVDFAIHILAHVAETRRQGHAPNESVVLTGARTGMALSLSTLTTVLAFLAFSITDFAGMAQLGVIGSAGVVFAFATAATLIPAVISLWPRLAGKVGSEPEPALRPMPGRRWRILPFLVLAIGLAALWPARHVRFDADPMALRNPEAPSVVAFRMLAESPRTTPYRANVLAPTEQKAVEIAQKFEGVPGVASAVTIDSLVPKDQDEKLMMLDIAAPSIQHAVSGAPTQLARNEGGPAMDRLIGRLSGVTGAARRLADALEIYRAHRTPESDAAVQKDLFRSFPLLISRLDAMLSAGPVTAENLPDRLRERYVSPGGVYRVEVLPSSDLSTPAEINRFADIVTSVAPTAAGGPVQLEAAGQTVAEAVLKAMLLTVFTTSVLAWFSTGRIADTVAILLPLGIAGAVTAAASVLLNMPFNYANVIVLPLMLGLGVDSGIHIALRERKAPGAVFATSTPRAVLFSALTTIAAFGTLSLSDHKGTASMGVLLSISVVSAVGAVLGLTPAIMRWLTPHPHRYPQHQR